MHIFLGIVLPTKPTLDFVPSPPTRDVDVDTCQGPNGIFAGKILSVSQTTTRDLESGFNEVSENKVGQRVFECSRLAG
jgi:hypothetical protein